MQTIGKKETAYGGNLKAPWLITPLAILFLLTLTAGCAPAAPPHPSSGPQAEGTPAKTTAVAKKAEKARIQTTRKTIAFVYFYFGQDKGIYKEDSIDIVIPEMKASLAIPALLAGEIDYTGQASTPFNSGLLGAPVKLLMSTKRTTIWHIVGGPGINSAADLKGKAIGLRSLGEASHYSTMKSLEKLGLDPKKDVSYVTIPGGTEVAALKSGSVAAAVLNEVQDLLVAQDLGYKKLIFTGDVIDIPIDGLGTTDRLLKENPDQVKRVIRATLRTLNYIKKKENREEVVQHFVKDWGMDRRMAEASWDFMDPILSTDGAVTDDGIRAMVEIGRASGAIKGEVDFKMGADFTLLKEVQKELGLGR